MNIMMMMMIGSTRKAAGSRIKITILGKVRQSTGDESLALIEDDWSCFKFRSHVSGNHPLQKLDIDVLLSPQFASYWDQGTTSLVKIGTCLYTLGIGLDTR